MNFVRASDSRSEFAAELPSFVAEVKRIFGPNEIREYPENVRRIGAMGHVATDEEFKLLREAGAFEGSGAGGA